MVGGGRKILARKIIYRKINFYQNHMLTNFVVKRGRWVYERGGLEQNSKSPGAITACLGMTMYSFWGSL